VDIARKEFPDEPLKPTNRPTDPRPPTKKIEQGREKKKSADSHIQTYPPRLEKVNEEEGKKNEKPHITDKQIKGQ